ncbi:MAG: exonuclease domain-containing protein [Myxococcota bacterium]
MPVRSPFDPCALRGVPVAVIDFETTGANPKTCEPVQVAVVHCNLGDTEPTLVHKALIRPEGPIEPGATAVHGITADMVSDAPGFADHLPTLLESLEGRVLAAFNLPFDWQVLSLGMTLAGLDAAEVPFGALDPLVWAKVVHRYERGKKLVDVAGRYGVEVDAHDAAGDALATATIMPKLLHDLGRHPEGGRAPLLSVEAMWRWTMAHGVAEEEGYAAWRVANGRSDIERTWANLTEGDR